MTIISSPPFISDSGVVPAISSSNTRLSTASSSRSPVGPDATGYEFDLYAFPELPAEQAQYVEQKFFDYADRVAAEALKGATRR